MKAFFLTSIFLLSSGCSIYRSEGRKQFEAEAPAKVEANGFHIRSCKKIGKLENWFKTEFPAHNYELIVADNDLEVWKTPVPSGLVEVTAIQKIDTDIHSCVYEFPNEVSWQAHKEQFLRELDSYLLSLE